LGETLFAEMGEKRGGEIEKGNEKERD